MGRGASYQESSTIDGSLSTLVIGIDAACETVMEPLITDDELPVLSGLLDKGTSDQLASQIPPWTPSAWPSLYTGTNPGKHGVFDFLTFDGYEWSVVDRSCVRTPAIWEYLNVHDRTSVVVNVPVTHPPTRFDGALVPGYTAPENPTCQPDGILADIRDAIGAYRVYPRHTGQDDAPRDEIIEEHISMTEMRGAAFRYLVDRFEPDFGFVQFQGTDSVVHELPEDEKALRAVYQAVDQEIGAIIKHSYPEYVFVVSDHGIGPYDGYEVRLNEVLRNAGYLSAVEGGRGMPTWASVRDTKLAKGNANTKPSQGALERVASRLARIGLTPQQAKPLLELLGLTEWVKRILPTEAMDAMREQVDFPHSKAYVRSRIECGVRINLEGREPNGIVPPEEYEAVRDEIIGLLSELQSPDGEYVFETVDRREAFFDGPAITDAVDVVTVPTDFDYFLSAQLGNDIFKAPREPWNHKYDGIISILGPDIDGDFSIANATILDVAPTVLATLGIPIADRMDGRVLPVVEDPGTKRYDITNRVKGTAHEGDTDQDADVMETHLADLGYLE